MLPLGLNVEEGLGISRWNRVLDSRQRLLEFFGSVSHEQLQWALVHHRNHTALHGAPHQLAAQFLPCCLIKARIALPPLRLRLDIWKSFRKGFEFDEPVKGEYHRFAVFHDHRGWRHKLLQGKILGHGREAQE